MKQFKVFNIIQSVIFSRSIYCLPRFPNYKTIPFLIGNNHCKKLLSSRSEIVNVTFIDRDNDVHHIKCEIGNNLLEVAHKNDIELEGACDGTLACCTCHLIVHPEWYNRLGTEPCEDEEDLLDMAYGLTDTSRLGCQIKVTKEHDGLIVKIPPFEPQYT